MALQVELCFAVANALIFASFDQITSLCESGAFMLVLVEALQIDDPTGFIQRVALGGISKILNAVQKHLDKAVELGLSYPFSCE